MTAPLGVVSGAHLVPRDDGVLGLEHPADEGAKLGLGDAQLRELLLDGEVPHGGAVGDGGVVLGQALDVEVGLLQHGHVKVLVLDPGRAPHAEGDEAVLHEARPPDPLPQLLLPRLHVAPRGVAVQADGVRQADGDAHPVPGVLLVVGALVPERLQQKTLDKDDAVQLVVEVVQELSRQKSQTLHSQRLRHRRQRLPWYDGRRPSEQLYGLGNRRHGGPSSPQRRWRRT